MDTSRKKLDAGTFVRLAEQCGLQLRKSDLMQMTRHQLLSPRQTEDDAEVYSPLHLVVVSRYLKAVRSTKHPWGTRMSEVELDDVSTFASELDELLEAAAPNGGADLDEEDIEDRLEALERFLEQIDPFGPLSEVFDLLQKDVVAEMRNAGRLYLEVRAAVDSLSSQLSKKGRPAPNGEIPRTRRLYDVDPDDVSDETVSESTSVSDGTSSNSSTREAIDEIVSAADESQHKNQSAIESESEAAPSMEAEEPRPMQSIQVKLEPDQSEGLDEESSEPLVLVEDENGDVHLEENSSDTDSTAGSTAGPAAPPPSPLERRAEFERKRRELTDDKNWDELVQLCEEHYEVFDEPQRRQKVLLEMAQIYEAKLRDRHKAFETFDRAWMEAEGRRARIRAFDGIQRLGKSSGFHQRYISWLQRRLDDRLEAGERARLHKELARSLFADQQYESAFDSYASFLTEAPGDQITVDTLNQLNILGEHVEDASVDEFYTTLGRRELDEATLQLIAEYRESAGEH